MFLYNQGKKIQFVSTKGHFWLFEALLLAALVYAQYERRRMTIVFRK